jgi:hypothetical protein
VGGGPVYEVLKEGFSGLVGGSPHGWWDRNVGWEFIRWGEPRRSRGLMEGGEAGAIGRVVGILLPFFFAGGLGDAAGDD